MGNLNTECAQHFSLLGQACNAGVCTAPLPGSEKCTGGKRHASRLPDSTAAMFVPASCMQQGAHLTPLLRATLAEACQSIALRLNMPALTLLASTVPDIGCRRRHIKQYAAACQHLQHRQGHVYLLCLTSMDMQGHSHVGLGSNRIDVVVSGAS